jgi:hypothetical protein
LEPIRKTPCRYFRQIFPKFRENSFSCNDTQKCGKICFPRKKLQNFVESCRKLQWILTRFTH